MPIPEYMRALREHVGHGLLLAPGATALVFNDRNEILLGQRADTKKWAVIGGAIEPGGESPAQAAIRETLEETGVTIEIERVSGVYTSHVVTYPNGDVCQFVLIAFRCRPIAGVPHPADDESIDIRYFPLDALPTDLSAAHRQRILEAAEPGAHLPAKFA